MSFSQADVVYRTLAAAVRGECVTSSPDRPLQPANINIHKPRQQTFADSDSRQIRQNTVLNYS